MPRDHATVNYGMVADNDYRSLPSPAQLLYINMWVAAGISYCGVRDWRPSRISGWTEDTTTADVLAAGDCLRARHFIVTDDDTEEALVRSWVRFDGVMRKPRLAISFVSAYYETASSTLRKVIVHEAKKLQRNEPELPCWSDPRVISVLEQESCSAKDLPPVSDPFEPGFAPGLEQTLHRVSTGVSTARTPSPTPTPLTPAPSGSPEVADEQDAPTPSAPAKKSGKKKSATPLGDDWRPTEDHLTRCIDRGLDPALELEKFRAHAEANDRRQVSWNAAFTQWLLTARPPQGGTVHPIRQGDLLPDADGNLVLPPLPAKTPWG